MNNRLKNHLLICVVVLGVFLSGCQSNIDSSIEKEEIEETINGVVLDKYDKLGVNKNYNFSDTKVVLDYKDVEKINVSVFPELFKAFDIVDSTQIKEVVDYFTSLNLLETNLDPKYYLGGGYSYSITMKDGTKRSFSHSGNMFFKEGPDFIYELLYGEAIKNNVVINKIIEENKSNSDEESSEGTILVLDSENSGRNISCVLIDNNLDRVKFYIRDANILDSTGKGNMQVHINDVVRIFYQSDNKDDEGYLIATTLFIHETTYGF